VFLCSISQINLTDRLTVDVASVSPTNDVPEDLSVCQLCNTLLRDPQIFPCFHAFCLACLGGMSQTAGTRVCCPLCSTAVIITSGGLDVLPGCLFLRKLLKLKENFGSEAALRCDICSGDNDAGVTFTSKMSTRCDIDY